MKKENEKKVKQTLGFMAKVVVGVAAGAAALGTAPFDRGYTARCVGSALAGNAGNIFSEIDKWVKSD